MSNRMEKLGASLLAGRISREDAALAAYSLPGEPRPEGVIRVKDAEMVQAVVRWAREEKAPLIAASSSAPHFHACLNVPEGAWIVDFAGMKRITAVNRRNRVALFEAGVTFEQLIPLLTPNGLRCLVPLMPRFGKSALASYLDREPTIYPKYQWDISDPLLCLEIVYGTGDLFRTGSAAGPGTIEEQWAAGEFQKSPMGPGQNDWMKLIQGGQGTTALATWCSAKCEIKPAMEKLIVAGADDLTPLVEASYRMFFRKLTDIHFILDRNALAALVGKTADEIEQAQKKANPWNLIFSVSGIEHFPEERINYFARESEKELKSQGAKIITPPIMSEEQILKLITNPLEMTAEDKNKMKLGFAPEPNFRDRKSGAHRRVYFQTTMDKASGFMARFYKLAGEAGIESNRVGRYLQPQLGGRCCQLEFFLALDPQNRADLEKVHEFRQQSAGPLIEAGAFFSRPHGEWSAPAMAKAKSSFWIYEKMKDIFDPDHILAPGRLMLGGE